MKFLAILLLLLILGCSDTNYIDAGNGDRLICSKYEDSGREAVLFLKSVGVFKDDNIPVTVKLDIKSGNREFNFIINPDNINDEIVDEFANQILDNLRRYRSFTLVSNFVNICDQNFKILKTYNRKFGH